MKLRSYNPLPTLLALPLGILAAVVGAHAVLAPARLADFMLREPAVGEQIAEQGIDTLVTVVSVAGGLVAATCFVAAVGGLFLWRGGLWLLRKGYLAVYVLLAFYTYAVLKASTDWGAFWDRWWMVPFVLVATLALHVVSWRAATIALYTGIVLDGLAPGDRILENLRTHGRDPRYRKSVYSSIAVHLLVIVGPILLELYGCVENYLVPHGSGTPSIAKVTFVRPKKKKPKKFILNPNAAIYFDVPDLDESEIAKDVDEDTQLTYTADPNAVHGAMGAGGGKEGGWPEGVGRHPIRFIRLQYRGDDWDDGMDPVSRADLNFLEEFERLTGLRTADHSEAHPMHYLAKYDKGFAPPFVYLTGSSGIHCSRRDIKILREYCLDGGMLFADAGSQRWDRSFRSFIQTVFPDKRLVVIADDDPLFQQPYAFPNGAPPLWHHGGKRALGIKHKNRWCVFYHPGDINDAWKTGHSGMEPRMARGAFQMGVNIIYYSFTHYLEETKKYRK